MTLVLAVPSKGRLEENARAFFDRAGLSLTRGRGARDYRGGVAGLGGLTVRYLSASEIARELAAGSVHLGVTGADLIGETIPDADDAVVMAMPLGFGHADVVIAVPELWLDVDTMADLDDLSIVMRRRDGRIPRVATKYLNLTRRHFLTHGLAEHRDYQLSESAGATEGAPASGAADLIVDITTTGSTLAANGLKVLADGIILKSEAHLVAARRADWTVDARATLKSLLDRVEAEARARATREVRAVVSGSAKDAALAHFPAGALAHGSDDGTVEVVALVPESEAFSQAAALKKIGARHISVRGVDYLLEPENRIHDDLAAALGWQAGS
ncbi:MAG: ATP phosphoribosyltransferase [Pseudomonadota bacterium]